MKESKFHLQREGLGGSGCGQEEREPVVEQRQRGIVSNNGEQDLTASVVERSGGVQTGSPAGTLWIAAVGLPVTEEQLKDAYRQLQEQMGIDPVKATLQRETTG